MEKNAGYPIVFNNMHVSTTLQSITKNRRSIILAGFLVAILLITGTQVHASVDWGCFRAAARVMFSGRSPFEVQCYYNPPWILVPLAPLALLPEGLGSLIVVQITILSYAYMALHFGASRWSLVAFLLSPPVLFDLPQSNINWLILLGTLLQPRWGLFLVLAKPQIGAMVAVFWLVRGFRLGGLKQVIKDLHRSLLCLP